MNNHLSRYQTGLSLVELMVAMAIGLILMLGATGVLLTNQQAFNTTDGLSAIQDSSRIAIDMIGRDLRAAGSHPCTAMQISNQSGADASELLGLIAHGVNLAPGDSPSNRVAAQGAISLVTSNDTRTITAHTTGSNVLTVQNEMTAGDRILACGGSPLATYLLTVSSRTASNVTTSVAPGSDLTGATVSSGLSTRLWYIGTNADGRPNSLYLRTDGGNPVEMVDGVAGLTVTEVGIHGIKVELVVCSRNADVRGMASTAQQAEQVGLCGANRIQRRVSTIVQRRA